MKILIVAIDEENGIGKNGIIPWHYKEDMMFFSKMTKDCSCIMGRKTYEDIFNKIGNKKQLLPNRESFVVSRNPDFKPYGATPVKSVQEGLDKASRINIFVMGGESIYKESLQYMDAAYVTHIPGKYDCDVNIAEVIKVIEREFEPSVEFGSEGLAFYKYHRFTT